MMIFNQRGHMSFQSFAEALKICLGSESGSREQDEALVYCMEHAPDDLKEILKARFVEFHTGGAHGQAGVEKTPDRHQESASACNCSGHRKPKLTDFIR
jgi:hypothetical protein